MEIWSPESSYKQTIRKSGGGPLGERDGDEDVFININEDINGVLRSLTDERSTSRQSNRSAKHELVRSLAIGFGVD
jgi:hypothetical protein